MQGVPFLHEVGAAAADELYISWQSAVRKAADRYEIVKENYQAGRYEPHTLTDQAIAMQKKLLDFFRGDDDEA